MTILLVNGSLDGRPDSTVNQIIHFLSEDLNHYPVTTTPFQLADAGVPLFDPNNFGPTPDSVQRMGDVFRGGRRAHLANKRRLPQAGDLNPGHVVARLRKSALNFFNSIRGLGR